jgi:hypothetical protein
MRHIFIWNFCQPFSKDRMEVSEAEFMGALLAFERVVDRGTTLKLHYTTHTVAPVAFFPKYVHSSQRYETLKNLEDDLFVSQKSL